MMKEWECDGARIVHGPSEDDWFYGDGCDEAEQTVRLTNAIIRERNWLELVAMAQMRGWRVDPIGDNGMYLSPANDRSTTYECSWIGTIADGHPHAAELARALGIKLEGSGT